LLVYRLRKVIYLVLAVSIMHITAVSVGKPASSEQPRLDIKNALKLVEVMEEAWSDVQDYTVLTYKKERHNGKLQPREKILTKFRRPFSVYMKWVKDNPPEHKNPNLGQEMIYEKGWNNNKVYAHLGKRNFLPATITSLAGYYYDWTALDPESKAATYYQRHTIDEVPFGDIISRIARAVRSGIEHPEDEVHFVDHGYKTVFGQPSGCIEGYLPGEKREAYYEDRIKVCVDLETRMPSQIVVRNGEGQILENYRMEEIKLNVGLDTQDFRPDNPNYNFQ